MGAAAGAGKRVRDGSMANSGAGVNRQKTVLRGSRREVRGKWGRTVARNPNRKRGDRVAGDGALKARMRRCLILRPGVRRWALRELEQVLRRVPPAVPGAGPIEGHADVVADLDEAAVTDLALQAAPGAHDLDIRACAGLRRDLDARSGGRNVLQVGYLFPHAAGFVDPHFHQVRAHESRFPSALSPLHYTSKNVTGFSPGSSSYRRTPRGTLAICERSPNGIGYRKYHPGGFP